MKVKSRISTRIVAERIIVTVGRSSSKGIPSKRTPTIIIKTIGPSKLKSMKTNFKELRKIPYLA